MNEDFKVIIKRSIPELKEELKLLRKEIAERTRARKLVDAEIIGLNVRAHDVVKEIACLNEDDLKKINAGTEATTK